MPVRTVKQGEERHYCAVCGHRHPGVSCTPHVLACIDAADELAHRVDLNRLGDGSHDLSLGESFLWIEELAEIYPEEFAELV